jgi:hypothetical protein
MSAEQVVDAVLARGPAQVALAGRRTGTLAVLAYHTIHRPDRFAAQLDWLDRHTRLVGVDDVIDAVAGRTVLPRRAALITFDDGDRSILDHALPLLEERGIPAAVYVVAGLIGTDLPPWTDEVRHLWTVGGRVEAVAADDGPGLVRALKTMEDEGLHRPTTSSRPRTSSGWRRAAWPSATTPSPTRACTGVTTPPSTTR